MDVSDLSVRDRPDEFDLDRYLRRSKRVDLSRVEWDRMGEVPVLPEEARCIAYMMDIETHSRGRRREPVRVPRLLELRGVLARRGVQPVPR